MPVTTTYDRSLLNQGANPVASLSQAPGTQQGAAVVSTTGGNAVVFYYDVPVGEIAVRTVARDGTLGARVQASSGSVFITSSQSGTPEPLSAARLSNGNLVVAWTSNEPIRRVYYRVFDANLNPLTPATRVDNLAGATSRPDVAALSGGGFVIAAQAELAADNFDIFYRRFGTTGTAVDANPVFLDTAADLDEAASVTGMADGGFAFAWQRRITTAGPTQGDTAVYTAVRNSDGSVRTAANLVDPFGGINRDVEVVERLNAGGYAILYEDSGWTSDPNDTELTAANFTASGIFETFWRLTTGGNNQGGVTAAALSPEGFIAYGFNDRLGGQNDVRFGLLDGAGQILSGSFAVAISGDEERVSSVTWLNGGIFRIAYDRLGGSGGSGDTDTSVDSQIFELVRFSTGDAANDVINWGTSVVRNVMNGLDGNDLLIGGSNNDELNGGNNDDTLIGNEGDDTLRPGAGTDNIIGDGGNDVIIFDGFLTASDSVDGGPGFDQVGITGNYSGANALVFGPTTLTNVEVLAALPGGSNSYSITTHNNTVAAGVEMTIFAGNLSLFNNFTFNGSAETDGFFRTFGGFGVDTITGGALSDGFYFGPGKWQAGDTVVGGGGTNDQLALDGNYSITVGSEADVEVLVLLSGPTGTPNTFSITLADAWAASGSNRIVFGRNVTTNLVIDGTAETGANLTYFGGFGSDELRTGGGIDTLYGLEGNDTLSGGLGNDTAVFRGALATYSFFTLAGTLNIEDNDAVADGNDGTDRFFSIQFARFSDQTINIVSPVILDLDGGGVTTLSAAESNAAFDMDGDGIGDDTSWFGGGEGLLFLDRDGNGTVSNAGEFSFVDDVPGARSDLEGLRAFDSNSDGELSRRDARFRDFKIWQDRNGNGVVDAREIMTLRQAGVRSLSLTGTAHSGTYAFGDTAIVNFGSFTRTNGRQGGLIDAVLTAFSSKPAADQGNANAMLATDDRLTALRDGLATQSDSAAGEFDSRVTLMTQDMASFGAAPGGTMNEFDHRRRGGSEPMVMFAD